MLTAVAAATLLLAQGAEPNLVVSMGHAQLLLPANVATVSIRAEAASDAEATARADAESLLVRAKASAQRVAGAAAGYETSDTTVEPKYGAGGFGGFPGSPASGGPAARGYVATASLFVRQVDPTKVDPLVEAVKRIEGASGSIVGYGLKDEAVARRAALKAAFADAKTKAQEVADAAGLRLGSVYLLDAGNGAILINGYDAGGTQPNSAPRLTPSMKVTAVANVTVRFRLVP